MPGIGYETLYTATRDIDIKANKDGIESVKSMPYGSEEEKRAKIKQAQELINDIAYGAVGKDAHWRDHGHLYWYIMINCGLITVGENFQIIGDDGALKQDLAQLVGDEGVLVFQLIRYIKKISLPNIQAEKLFWEAYFAVAVKGKDSGIKLPDDQVEAMRLIPARIKSILGQDAIKYIGNVSRENQILLLKNFMLESLLLLYKNKDAMNTTDELTADVVFFKSLDDIKYFAEMVLKVSGDENLAFKNLLNNLSEEELTDCAEMVLKVSGDENLALKELLNNLSIEEQTDLVKFGKVMRSVIVEGCKEETQLNNFNPNNLDEDLEIKRYLQLKYNGTIPLEKFKQIIDSKLPAYPSPEYITQLIKLVKPAGREHQYQAQIIKFASNDPLMLKALDIYLMSGPEDIWTKALKRDEAIVIEDIGALEKNIKLLTAIAEVLDLDEKLQLRNEGRIYDTKADVTRYYALSLDSTVVLLAIRLGYEYDEAKEIFYKLVVMRICTAAECRARIAELHDQEGSGKLNQPKAGLAPSAKAGGTEEIKQGNAQSSLSPKSQDDFSYKSLIFSTLMTIVVPLSLSIIKAKLHVLPAFLRTSKLLDAMLKMSTVGVVFNVMMVLCVMRAVTSKPHDPLLSLRETNLPIFIAYAVIDKAFDKSPRQGK